MGHKQTDLGHARAGAGGANRVQPEFYSDSSGGEVPGYGPSATTFVKLLYRAMAGQAADPTAAPVYIQQLQAGLPAPLVSLQFVTSDTFRAAKIQEIYQVALGEAATTDQISQYESRWYFDGGLAGIATTLLASAANIDRIEAGQVTLPDMQAAAQLQQLLLANYTSDPDGFVKLMNTLLNASEASPCSATSATCNTALYNLLTSGGSDRGFPNSALQVAGMTANVGSLIPTQNEIDMSKSLVYPLTDHTTLDTYFAGGTILPPGGVILTADDGTFIVDGHHRWSAIFVINPNAQVSTVDMGYVPNPQEALKEAQIGVVAQTGYLKTATTSGANLYTVDQAVFYATVNDYILNGTTKNPPDTVEVLKSFTKYLGLDGQTQEQKLASIDAYLWGNVLRMRQYNQPIPDATSRDVMPQVEPLTPILNYLQSGALSYTFPTIAYLG
ncbi:hypothetical protein B1R94_06645 [Mycolicibacterium litorale]|nr:hypothetical protein B1R94_06645 [Mycolicibacterium litorale]